MTVRVRMSGEVNGWTSKTFVRTKGSVTVTVRMSRQVNEWTNKTVEKTKRIGNCDSENECTSKWVDK